MEHKAPTRHTPTKDRMSLKRCRDQWPGIPFPVSGQRRVTRRYRVTRTRNFSKNTKGRPEHHEGQEEAKKEDRMARKDIDDGKDEEGEETGRPNVVVPFVRPSLTASSFCLSIGHVISTRSILLFLRAHIEGMSRRTYIGYVTSARLFRRSGSHAKSRRGHV